MRLIRTHKVCRNCNHLVLKKESRCPVCGEDNFSDRWRGLIIVLDKSSYVAGLMGIEKEGYYAVKVV